MSLRIHRWLDFKVTARCNNHARKCSYCAVPITAPDAPESLTMSVVHRTLSDARALGFDRFWLLGGEPTLREEGVRLFEPLSDDDRAVVTVVTNGKEPNWRLFEALFATSTAASRVQVSLDGMHAENAKRADPEKVRGVVRKLNSMGRLFRRPSHECEVEVHCVICRENMATFDSFAMDLAREGVPTSLAMVCPWTMVDAPAGLNEFTRCELEDIAGRIRSLRTGFPCDRFNPLVAEFVEDSLAGAAPRSACCGGGVTHLVIAADGDAYRCTAHSFCHGERLGNVRKERLHAMLPKAGKPVECPRQVECFDAFAWDRLALGEG